MDGPSTFTVVADIGAFAAAHPPATAFFVPSGVQYALEPFRGGFLVTDGHHNRVLQVSRDGAVSVLLAFDDIVPTGLAASGDTIYMAEAGPVPHRPADGKVVVFGPRSTTAAVVAAGAPLLVDVAFGRGRQLFALAQGTHSTGPEGSPADPHTGALVRAEGGGFAVILGGLDRPTSLEIVGDTAYVVTLTGEIWRSSTSPARPTVRHAERQDRRRRRPPPACCTVTCHAQNMEGEVDHTAPRSPGPRPLVDSLFDIRHHEVDDAYRLVMP